MVEPTNVVYLVTNKINGKMYVGMTTKGLRHRKNRHLSHARSTSNSLICRAIRKYGESNFKWEVIFISNDRDELLKIESELINRLDTFKNGYNQTIGGDGIVGLSGELNGASKITEKTAIDIIECLLRTTMTIREIAFKFDVSEGLVKGISNGYNWSHLYKTRPSENRPHGAKGNYISQEKAVAIVDRIINSDLSLLEISKVENVSYATVNAIANGKTFKNLYNSPPNKIRKAKKEKEREKILAIYNDILKLSELSASNGEFKLTVDKVLFSKDSDDKFISDNEFDEYLFSEVTEKLEADGFTVEKFFTGNISIYW